MRRQIYSAYACLCLSLSPFRPLPFSRIESPVAHNERLAQRRRTLGPAAEFVVCPDCTPKGRSRPNENDARGAYPLECQQRSPIRRPGAFDIFASIASTVVNRSPYVRICMSDDPASDRSALGTTCISREEAWSEVYPVYTARDVKL